MEEWAVVKAAPLMFGLAVLLAGFLIFFALEWLHREKVNTLEQRLAAKETSDFLALFREREKLEQQVAALKSGSPLGFGTEIGDDYVRDEGIERKQRRITELNKIMSTIKGET